MDAILAAYNSGSEGSDGENGNGYIGDGTDAQAKRQKTIGPLPSPALSFYNYFPPPIVEIPGAVTPQRTVTQVTEVPGRYVSKRERAAMAAAASDTPHSPPVHPPPALESVLNAKLPQHIQKRMDYALEKSGGRSRCPKEQVIQLEGHNKAVSAVQWSPTHGALLASAGMDQKVYIWNAWEHPGHQIARCLTCHTGAVKDVRWSLDGTSVLSCGFDETARLSDVETASQIQVFKENQYINVVRFHPLEASLFLAGGSKGTIKLWDIRIGSSVCEYSKSLGQVLDVDFSPDGKRFISTSDIAKRNASDKALVVWNFARQIPLSNQVYLEAYTCPSVRFHPFEQCFIAQSNANYIAIFSGRSPFKLNKYKRFEGHQVAGYRVQCNFSPDGESLVTGSADGYVYFYNYHSSKLLKKLKAHEGVCSDGVYHPFLPSVVATCGWDGIVSIFE